MESAKPNRRIMLRNLARIRRNNVCDCGKHSRGFLSLHTNPGDYVRQMECEGRAPRFPHGAAMSFDPIQRLQYRDSAPLRKRPSNKDIRVAVQESINNPPHDLRLHAWLRRKRLE